MQLLQTHALRFLRRSRTNMLTWILIIVGLLAIIYFSFTWDE